MISLISTILNAILNFIIFILKAVFSMLAWFLKSIAKMLKLFYCALPLTSIAFILLFFANIYMVLMGIPNIGFINQYKNMLSKDAQISVSLFNELKIWWTLNVYPYRGSIVFVLLIVLSVIMILPVGFVLLSISTVLSFGQFLFFAAAADIVIYMLRAIFQKSFASQFLDRFYKVFPDRGKRHYEKNYEKWLRKHHSEFEDDYESQDEYEPRRFRSKVDDFYEDDDEDYDAIEEYDDENYEDYENDDDIYPHVNSHSSAFNFFAGCSSKESIDRKYKSLVKLYHPDNMDGDTNALQEINAQYSEAKKRFAN